MSSYVGVDYGSWMLKAAVADTDARNIDVLPLSAELNQVFIPAVSNATESEESPWSTYLRRYTDSTVGYALRDRLSRTTDSTAVAGGTITAVNWHRSLLTALRRAIERARPDVAGVAMTIPDHWAGSNLALPVALHQAGWNPSVIMPEWVAILAAQGPSPDVPVICLSLGAGAAHATLVVAQGKYWAVVAHASNSEASGFNLRRRLAEKIIDSTMDQLRQDPRESLAEDQKFHDQLEVVLFSLRESQDAMFDAQLFGKRIRGPFSKSKLIDLAAPVRNGVGQIIQQLLKKSGFAGHCRVLIWGELADRLPVADWITAFQKGMDCQIVDVTTVARGAARLAALVANRDENLQSMEYGGLQRETGRYIPASQARSDDTYRLLEHLPIELGPRDDSKIPSLVWADSNGNPQRLTVRGTLRLGRDPALEMSFPQDRYPEVSRVHAEITTAGKTHLLRDLSSHNGTYVNGRPINKEHELNDGEVISLGANGPKIEFCLPARSR